MTKPTSRCIDIRQEHPLMDKFKEWLTTVIYCCTPCKGFWDAPYYGVVDGNMVYCEGKVEEHFIITLDQRRERRGKGYYEKPRK